MNSLAWKLTVVSYRTLFTKLPLDLQSQLRRNCASVIKGELANCKFLSLFSSTGQILKLCNRVAMIDREIDIYCVVLPPIVSLLFVVVDYYWGKLASALWLSFSEEPQNIDVYVIVVFKIRKNITFPQETFEGRFWIRKTFYRQCIKRKTFSH